MRTEREPRTVNCFECDCCEETYSGDVMSGGDVPGYAQGKVDPGTIVHTCKQSRDGLECFDEMPIALCPECPVTEHFCPVCFFKGVVTKLYYDDTDGFVCPWVCDFEYVENDDALLELWDELAVENLDAFEAVKAAQWCGFYLEALEIQGGFCLKFEKNSTRRRNRLVNMQELHSKLQAAQRKMRQALAKLEAEND